MPHVHGSWGHHVKPGRTDPKRYGSYYSHHLRVDLYDADSPEERTALLEKAVVGAGQNGRKAKRGGSKKSSSAKKAASEQPPQWPAVDRTLLAQRTSAFSQLPLVVRDRKNEVLLLCKKNKGALLRALLMTSLPQGSVVETSEVTMQLTKDVRELGFDSVPSFRMWCGKLGRM